MNGTNSFKISEWNYIMHSCTSHESQTLTTRLISCFRGVWTTINALTLYNSDWNIQVHICINRRNRIELWHEYLHNIRKPHSKYEMNRIAVLNDNGKQGPNRRWKKTEN